MKIAVRYQTIGGNTRLVADTIANVAGVKAETIKTTIDEPVDILFIGGGVYAWTIARNLKKYLENLDPDKIRYVAAFTTGGLMGATEIICKIVKAKNIKYCEIKLPLKVFFKNYGGVTKNTVKLNENQILKVRNFAEKIIKSLAPKNEDKS